MILFIPMWDHEVERLGVKRCSRAAYALMIASDYATLAAFLLALASFAYFHWPWLWPTWLCWLGGRLLLAASYTLLARRQFRYDAATTTAHWQDPHGTPQQYNEADYQREYG